MVAGFAEVADGKNLLIVENERKPMLLLSGPFSIDIKASGLHE
jgi:hypothetical protein